jgi:hypothetical protein
MYAAVTAVIFAIVVILHFMRLIKRWPVNIGSHAVPMSVSWAVFLCRHCLQFGA